ncbi:hypothetical protein FRX31_019672 [Thalictrum thalictroides]|uniref:Uncharacterized protein n=1 Tax=Thalictrum thalictroides TaxID=46969 RepID=A0A7J6W2K6_THATH|nr:hypothetical protein FRX31_019672 [Thalictrum thalictroides]
MDYITMGILLYTKLGTLQNSNRTRLKFRLKAGKFLNFDQLYQFVISEVQLLTLDWRQLCGTGIALYKQ